MTDAMRNLNEASTSADLHPAFVIALLHERGLSLRRLAIRHGYKPRTFSDALYRDYPRVEKLIADALQRKPEEIWPVRIAARRRRKASSA
jgi:Ner family transcriptional regulator